MGPNHRGSACEHCLWITLHTTEHDMDVRSFSVPESCCVPSAGLSSAMSGACASDAVERVAAARAAAKATAKALPKSRGRHRNEDRPRIDIDDEIESANELSTLMKKFAHAAKMSQRNSVRCKARLVKKCGKLSVQDLERLAVLKRCGLLVTDEPVDAPMASASSSGALASDSQPRKKKSSVEMLKKLADVVSKSGGQDVLSCVTDLQEMLKHDEVHQHLEGDLATAKKNSMPTKGAAAGGPAAAEELDESMNVKTAMEPAAGAEEDADVEDDV